MARNLSPEAKQNKKVYDHEWQKNNMRQVRFVLNVRTDADIIERLDMSGNVRGYLKSLIRADIARNPSPASADQGEQGEQSGQE